MTERMPITKQGLTQMEEELKQLKSVARPEVIRAIAQAREHGDLSENAEYHAARERQSFIEGRLAELEDKIARSEVIDVATLSGKTVMFGATVTIIDEDTEEKLP
jgi:transcription elongation factor GreA